MIVVWVAISIIGIQGLVVSGLLLHDWSQRLKPHKLEAFYGVEKSDGSIGYETIRETHKTRREAEQALQLWEAEVSEQGRLFPFSRWVERSR